jgi:hypothetical protein
MNLMLQLVAIGLGLGHFSLVLQAITFELGDLLFFLSQLMVHLLLITMILGIFKDFDFHCKLLGISLGFEKLPPQVK